MKLLTMKEAAAVLRRSPQSLYASGLREALPWRKVAGRILVSEADLQRYLDGCREHKAA